ncbi:beta-mannosidase-like [Zophobas morio]|uniref:beta-mannosidase-like n=1 Tax=Zophobas morio TaxID=2755281 RepID=UPI0030827CD7
MGCGFGIILLFVVHFVDAQTRQSLNGDWLLKDESGEYLDLNAKVPGGIYTDLMNNGVLDNIYAGFNDVEYKWVARSNWSYYTTFEVREALTDYYTINLVLEGVDTFSTILINDVEVGTTQNMFVKYIFNITEQIKVGDNTIEVKFLSPISAVDDLAAKHEQNYVVPPECVPDSYKGECHVNYLRKIPASFSWDWGPAFPSVGIWKDIYLQGYYCTLIEYVVAEVLDTGDNWTLSIDTYFSPPADIVGLLGFELETANEPITVRNWTILTIPNEYGEVVNTTEIVVPKTSVETWWPNGYGKQPLYTLGVSFDSVFDYSYKEIKIGFRKIELIQDELEMGRSFYFQVNDVPIFAMGVNSIPFDILPENSYNLERLNHFMSSVATYTEMNMIRVWGGGVYESDLFYQLADEYGLMIWQDFVFASSMYPADDDFLNNVKSEVNHQVKRIQSHPSLALWGGNNENEGNLASNYFNTADNFEVYKADYIKLYIDTVRDEMRRITKNANFVDSSPSNGIETDSEGYVSLDPGSLIYGDVHFYTNNRDSFDTSIYPIPRFSSEYGFQSLPSVSSWLTVTDNLTDLSINSDFMKHRQHHPDGNDPLKNLIEFQLELPSENNEYYDEALIYYTQIIQAMSIKIETEHYRRHMGRVDNDGRGYTMGALFWQLNDVWVAPSWSSIDYTGKWKMLHYFVPGFFSQELVTGHANSDNQLEVYHILNKEYGVGEKWINLTIYAWDSFTPVNGTQFVGEFEPVTSTLIATLDIDQYLSDSGCGSVEEARFNCFIHFVAGLGTITLTPSNYFFPSKFKEANLVTSNLEILAVDNFDAEGLRFLIALRADAPCLFVWLDAGDTKGHFLENGFIQHSLVTTVIFVADEPTTVESLQATLTVTHVKDPKYFPTKV